MFYTKKQKELFNRIMKQINKNVENSSKENNKMKILSKKHPQTDTIKLSFLLYQFVGAFYLEFSFYYFL